MGKWGNGEMGRWEDGKMGRWEDGKMGRWGDGEMGKWGNGEMGRWGDEIKNVNSSTGRRGLSAANLKPKPLKHKTMNLISKIMMYVSQIIGLVATVRGFNEVRKMRNNPELKKAREMMKQQEIQVNQTAVHD